MKILFVSVEVAPLAKVGGLADVAGSLPKALQKLGHDARVVMPGYQMILDDPRWVRKTVLREMPVRINSDWTKIARVDVVDVAGVPVYLISTDQWFNETSTSAEIYSPGIGRYEFFSEAVLELSHAMGWTPDVVHCNDWHTGFIPVLMREKHRSRWDGVGSVFTIHNFAYQGEFGTDVLDSLELPHYLYNPEGVEAWGRVNFLKSGCVFCDHVNTVSPRYAQEIQTPEFGNRLEGLMTHLARHGRLSGILNGIDTEVFDPATDPILPSHYSASDVRRKAACRKALLKRVEMEPIEGAPVLGVVSRLSHQKGLDLVAWIAERMFELPTQLVVQGLGDPAIASDLRRLQRLHPNHIRFVEEFDETMAQLVYAGSDMFLMPSAFEPCGLGQMIALRYGTIPIVRRTGGLADTIEEGRNGFVFDRIDPEDLITAVWRACAAYADKKTWTRLVKTALKEDFGWSKSAQEYVALYEAAIAARPQPASLEAAGA